MEGITTKYSKEESLDKLTQLGYIKTKVFGWITTNEAEWINKKLERTNLNKTVEELEGIPAYDVEVTESKKIGGSMQEITKRKAMVYPLFEEFFAMRKAKDANFRELQKTLI